MPDRNALTEWFHDLAGKSAEDLKHASSPANLDKLRAHISLSLPDCSPPDDLKGERFAEVVLQLRANEIAWNQATMAALIKADDLFKNGQASEARSELQAFAANCPWSLFKEVALDQAMNYV